MILKGCILPDIERADFVSRWQVISRACVLSMTVTSGLIGALFLETVIRLVFPGT